MWWNDIPGIDRIITIACRLDTYKKIRQKKKRWDEYPSKQRNQQNNHKMHSISRINLSTIYTLCENNIKHTIVWGLFNQWIFDGFAEQTTVFGGQGGQRSPQRSNACCDCMAMEMDGIDYGSYNFMVIRVSSRPFFVVVVVIIKIHTLFLPAFSC